MVITMMVGILSAAVLLLIYGVLPEVKKFMKHKQFDIYLIILAFLSGALAPTIRLIGLTHSTVLNLVIITSFQIPITALMSHWILKEKLTKSYFVGVSLLILGLIMYSTQCFQTPFQVVPADALLLLSSFTYACGDMIYKKKLTHVPHEMILITRNMFGSIILMVGIFLLALETKVQFTMSPQTFLYLSLIILLPIILGQMMWYKAMVKIKETEAVLLDASYAIFSSVIALLVLGEMMTWYQLAGGVVILLGVVVSHIHIRKHKVHKDLFIMQRFKMH